MRLTAMGTQPPNDIVLTYLMIERLFSHDVYCYILYILVVFILYPALMVA